MTAGASFPCDTRLSITRCRAVEVCFVFFRQASLSLIRVLIESLETYFT